MRVNISQDFSFQLSINCSIKQTMNNMKMQQFRYSSQIRRKLENILTYELAKTFPRSSYFSKNNESLAIQIFNSKPDRKIFPVISGLMTTLKHLSIVINFATTSKHEHCSKRKCFLLR